MAVRITKREVAERYIQALEVGQMDSILELFAPEGLVVSPIYGTQVAAHFYRHLAEDTTQSQLHINGIFEEADQARLALYFEYIWTLRSGKVVQFDVVDILEFNQQNQIEKLTIIYDTLVSRQLVAEL